MTSATTRIALHHYMAAVVCVLVIAGCHGAARPPTTRPSSALRASMPAASQEALFVGMDLGDAMEMLTRHHVNFSTNAGEWGTTQPVAVDQLFIIERDDIEDAIFFYATSKRGERMRIEYLYWYRNHRSDMKLKKGVRKREKDHVQSISMAEIVRTYSFEVNP